MIKVGCRFCRRQVEIDSVNAPKECLHCGKRGASVPLYFSAFPSEPFLGENVGMLPVGLVILLVALGMLADDLLDVLFAIVGAR